MSRLQLSRLFKPFTKIKSNRQLNKEGVGLGLAVSRNISIALEGDITVKSQQGMGSTFTLTLPLPKKDQVKNQLLPPINASIVIEQSNEDDASFESQNYNLKHSNQEEEPGTEVIHEASYLFKYGSRSKAKFNSLVNPQIRQNPYARSIQTTLDIENEFITRQTRGGASTRTFIENRRPRRFSSSDTV